MLLALTQGLVRQIGRVRVEHAGIAEARCLRGKGEASSVRCGRRGLAGFALARRTCGRIDGLLGREWSPPVSHRSATGPSAVTTQVSAQRPPPAKRCVVVWPLVAILSLYCFGGPYRESRSPAPRAVGAAPDPLACGTGIAHNRGVLTTL